MTSPKAATPLSLEEELAQTKAALLELRTAVGKETGELVEMNRRMKLLLAEVSKQWGLHSGTAGSSAATWAGDFSIDYSRK